MITRLVAVEPLDSFFFPDHRPFNQDDPGLSEAATRFPPPPHVMAGAVRFAIARRLGWDEGVEARRQHRDAGQTGREGDWCDFHQADGINLGEEANRRHRCFTKSLRSGHQRISCSPLPC